MGDLPPTAASAENAFAAGLFDALPARYDRLAETLSFHQNRKWRGELVRHITRFQPQRILDVATGTGGVAIALARATDAQIVGVDITESMLERGRERVRLAGLDGRIRLQMARAEELPFPDGHFDAVTFTYLLRYVADPAATIAEIARVLCPGGGMASLDFYVPHNPFWRTAWRGYTRLLLPAGGFLLGGRPWAGVGRFLGPNIEDFYRKWPLHRIFEAWRTAGMVDDEHEVMSLGGGLVMWGRKHHA
ncbi:MAG TPA: class I SAM-dependent methyltransferase [Candidatus Dormibacteraeota bacterium]|nr:class I SAM-dependent methyltransferase [Candidatus Dormibacteraeota bacterium]